MKPGRKHRVAVESVERAKCGGERVLDGILRVRLVVQKSAGGRQHTAAASLYHQPEGVLVAGTQLREQLCFVDRGGCGESSDTSAPTNPAHSPRTQPCLTRSRTRVTPSLSAKVTADRSSSRLSPPARC